MLKRWNGNAGQAATESMLVISVVAISIVAAGYSFVPMFRGGVSALATDVAEILETGEIGGVGGRGGDVGNAGTANGTAGGGTGTEGPAGAANGRPGNGRRYVPSNNGNDMDNRGTWPPNRDGLGGADQG